MFLVFREEVICQAEDDVCLGLVSEDVVDVFVFVLVELVFFFSKLIDYHVRYTDFFGGNDSDTSLSLDVDHFREPLIYCSVSDLPFEPYTSFL